MCALISQPAEFASGCGCLFDGLRSGTMGTRQQKQHVPLMGQQDDLLVLQRPWGSWRCHIAAGVISTFMMHFPCVVSTESWQRSPHRLLDVRLDVAFSGLAAIIRHFDNIIDIDMGTFLLDQVCQHGLPDSPPGFLPRQHVHLDMRLYLHVFLST